MIEKLFREHGGYLHSKDLQRNRQLYYHLQKMVESGVVLKLRRGLYKHSEYAELIIGRKYR